MMLSIRLSFCSFVRPSLQPTRVSHTFPPAKTIPSRNSRLRRGLTRGVRIHASDATLVLVHYFFNFVYKLTRSLAIAKKSRSASYNSPSSSVECKSRNNCLHMTSDCCHTFCRYKIGGSWLFLISLLLLINSLTCWFTYLHSVEEIHSVGTINNVELLTTQLKIGNIFSVV